MASLTPKPAGAGGNLAVRAIRARRGCRPKQLVDPTRTRTRRTDLAGVGVRSRFGVVLAPAISRETGTRAQVPTLPSGSGSVREALEDKRSPPWIKVRYANFVASKPATQMVAILCEVEA